MIPQTESLVTTSTKCETFHLDIVEPMKFHLAEDYLSEGFENRYNYPFRCLNFIPLKIVRWRKFGMYNFRNLNVARLPNRAINVVLVAKFLIWRMPI